MLANKFPSESWGDDKGATMVTAVTKGVTRKSGSALLGTGQ